MRQNFHDAKSDLVDAIRDATGITGVDLHDGNLGLDAEGRIYVIDEGAIRGVGGVDPRRQGGFINPGPTHPLPLSHKPGRVTRPVQAAAIKPGRIKPFRNYSASPFVAMLSALGAMGAAYFGSNSDPPA
jgi:hypothetical protein